MVIEEIRSLAGIEIIRREWEYFNEYPEVDLDYYSTVVRFRPEVISPFIIVLRDLSGNPITLVIGRIENIPFEFNLGYKNIFSPIIRCLNVIYRGIIGNQDDEVDNMVIRHLISILDCGDVDAVCLNHLQVDSVLFQKAKSFPRYLQRDHVFFPNVHWKLTLGGSFKDFLGGLSKVNRRSALRYMKRLEEDHDGEIMLRCITGREEIDKLLEDIESVASKTYQRGLGVGFQSSEEHRERILLAMNKNWFQGYVLYISGKPCAFWTGLLYKNTFFTYTTGYDPSYQEYRIGTVVLMKLIKEICDRGQASEIDFGLGDAEYKRRYCNRSEKEASVYIFSKKLKGISLNAMRSFTGLSNEGGIKLLKKFKLLDAMKKNWRKKLIHSRFPEDNENSGDK